MSNREIVGLQNIKNNVEIGEQDRDLMWVRTHGR